jgi:hypothetical protein
MRRPFVCGLESHFQSILGVELRSHRIMSNKSSPEYLRQCYRCHHKRKPQCCHCHHKSKPVSIDKVSNHNSTLSLYRYEKHCTAATTVHIGMDAKVMLYKLTMNDCYHSP